ncbi:hypothetical protein NC651_023640 [Populus alba x Populus x berolinensis]|nr:hypothetical protein NC651_023640 [Populus alba x Populus x berolinensis]
MTQQLMEPYHIQGSTQKCMKVASLFLVVRIKLKTNGGGVLLSSPMKIEEQQDEATEKEISHDESNTTSSFSTRPRGYLDLVNSSKLTKNKFVGSEFDTRLDAHFKDPNDHHVCLDIDSLNSIKIVEPILQGIDLKSGDFDHCWD